MENATAFASFLSGTVFGAFIAFAVLVHFLSVKSSTQSSKKKNKLSVSAAAAKVKAEKDAAAAVLDAETKNGIGKLVCIIDTLEDINFPLKTIGQELKRIHAISAEDDARLKLRMRSVIEHTTLHRLEKEFAEDLSELKTHGKHLKVFSQFLGELSKACSSFAKDINKLSQLAKTNLKQQRKASTVTTTAMVSGGVGGGSTGGLGAGSGDGSAAGAAGFVSSGGASGGAAGSMVGGAAGASSSLDQNGNVTNIIVFDSKEEEIMNKWWHAMFVLMSNLAEDQDELTVKISDELVEHSLLIQEEFVHLEKRFQYEGGKSFSGMKDQLMAFEGRIRERDKFKDKLRSTQDKDYSRRVSKLRDAEEDLQVQTKRLYDAQKEFFTQQSVCKSEMQVAMLKSVVETQTQLLKLTDILDRAQDGNRNASRRMRTKLTEAAAALMISVRQDFHHKYLNIGGAKPPSPSTSKNPVYLLTENDYNNINNNDNHSCSGEIFQQQQSRREGGVGAVGLYYPEYQKSRGIEAGAAGTAVSAGYELAIHHVLKNVLTELKNKEKRARDSGAKVEEVEEACGAVVGDNSGSCGGGGGDEVNESAVVDAPRDALSAPSSADLDSARRLSIHASEATAAAAAAVNEVILGAGPVDDTTQRAAVWEARGMIHMHSEYAACLSASNPDILPQLPTIFHSAISTETCVWFNCFSGRVYRDISRSRKFYRWFCDKLAMVLNKGPRPSVVDEFQVLDVKFGALPPLLLNVKWCPPYGKRTKPAPKYRRTRTSTPNPHTRTHEIQGNRQGSGAGAGEEGKCVTRLTSQDTSIVSGGGRKEGVLKEHTVPQCNKKDKNHMKGKNGEGAAHGERGGSSSDGDADAEGDVTDLEGDDDRQTFSMSADGMRDITTSAGTATTPFISSDNGDVKTGQENNNSDMKRHTGLALAASPEQQQQQQQLRDMGQPEQNYSDNEHEEDEESAEVDEILAQIRFIQQQHVVNMGVDIGSIDANISSTATPEVFNYTPADDGIDDTEYYAACTADMVFRSGIKFTIATKLNVVYTSVPITLTLEVAEMSGRIKFGVSKGYSFMTFLKDPLMRMHVTSEFGSDQFKLKNVPMLSDMIVKQIKSFVHRKFVYPNSHKMKLLWPRNWWPEGTEHEFMDEEDGGAVGSRGRGVGGDGIASPGGGTSTFSSPSASSVAGVGAATATTAGAGGAGSGAGDAAFSNTGGAVRTAGGGNATVAGSSPSESFPDYSHYKPLSARTALAATGSPGGSIQQQQQQQEGFIGADYSVGSGSGTGSTAASKAQAVKRKFKKWLNGYTNSPTLSSSSSPGSGSSSAADGAGESWSGAASGGSSSQSTTTRTDPAHLSFAAHAEEDEAAGAASWNTPSFSTPTSTSAAAAAAAERDAKGLRPLSTSSLSSSFSSSRGGEAGRTSTTPPGTINTAKRFDPASALQHATVTAAMRAARSATSLHDKRLRHSSLPRSFPSSFSSSSSSNNNSNKAGKTAGGISGNSGSSNSSGNHTTTTAASMHPAAQHRAMMQPLSPAKGQAEGRESGGKGNSGGSSSTRNMGRRTVSTNAVVEGSLSLGAEMLACDQSLHDRHTFADISRGAQIPSVEEVEEEEHEQEEETDAATAVLVESYAKEHQKERNRE